MMNQRQLYIHFWWQSKFVLLLKAHETSDFSKLFISLKQNPWLFLYVWSSREWSNLQLSLSRSLSYTIPLISVRAKHNLCFSFHPIRECLEKKTLFRFMCVNVLTVVLVSMLLYIIFVSKNEILWWVIQC